MKGLHNAFLKDTHVIMGVSIDNTNNGIFFVEANFNPEGFTKSLTQSLKSLTQSLFFHTLFEACSPNSDLGRAKKVWEPLI